MARWLTDSRRVQGRHDFTTGDRLRALGNDHRSNLIWNVLVVATECALGDADPLGECVQFIERCVTHEVTPHAVAPRPMRFIDEQCHALTLPFGKVT